MKGSYTIEAAVIMSIFCFMSVEIIRHGYRIYDETTGKMILHESVEEARHISDWEETEQLEELEEKGGRKKQGGFIFENFNIQLRNQTKRIHGEAEATTINGQWSVQIEAEQFRPEEFLRKIEAVKQLEERNGSSL